MSSGWFLPKLSLKWQLHYRYVLFSLHCSWYVITKYNSYGMVEGLRDPSRPHHFHVFRGTQKSKSGSFFTPWPEKGDNTWWHSGWLVFLMDFTNVSSKHFFLNQITDWFDIAICSPNGVQIWKGRDQKTGFFRVRHKKCRAKGETFLCQTL